MPLGRALRPPGNGMNLETGGSVFVQGGAMLASYLALTLQPLCRWRLRRDKSDADVIDP